LIRERAAEINRIQKTLEGANIKLGDVASDILGVSARRMLDALVGGATDPTLLADLAKDKLRKKIPQLQRALKGEFGSHHRFLLAQQLAHLDGLDELIDQLGSEIAERVRPVAHVVERVDAIPGFGRRTAEIVIAEIGIDLSRFPSFKHLASWVGLCPGNNESAGKRMSGKTRKGGRVATLGVDRSCTRGQSKQEHLPGGALPPNSSAERQEEGDRRVSAHALDDHLLPAHA